ncbi:PP2C family protein-serine/threonine phosphatase [Acidicapsa acidisoli]|uniref:PP2C family protein-serine/threonine phosphatase n=1 Tax=Acidicapsa acidisoli TaxID=1615681 RepID=UPI0021E0BD69|nr:PP2C family protein-serine/threonine phosphatase [Acidicapsa acidisoli]
MQATQLPCQTSPKPISEPVSGPVSEPIDPRRRRTISVLPILASILVLVLFSAASSILAQQPSSAASSQASQPPFDHPHGPPGLPFPHPHPNIRPPKGKIPDAGTPVVFDAAGMGSPLVLDHNWRLGIASGSDPAKPDFDDSTWPTRDAKEAVAEVDDSAAEDDSDHPPDHDHDDPSSNHHPHGHPFAWFRIHIHLPVHHGPLVVLVRVPVSRNAQVTFNETVGMDMFANGKLIVPEGPNGPTQQSYEYQQISRIYPIDIPQDQANLTLAVRIPFVALGMDAYTGFFAHRTFYLGERDDLVSHLDLWDHAMLFERIPALVDGGLKFLIALFLLALFWTQRDHPEYLWLGLQMLLVAPLAYIGFVGSMGRIDKLWTAASEFQLLLISAYLYFEFLIAFLSLRRRWYIIAMRYSSPLLLTLGPFLLFVRDSKAVAIGFVLSILFALLWMLAWVLFVGLTLTIAAFKRNYEAALLLLPLLLSVVGMVELASTAGSSSWLGTPMQSPLTFQAGPVPIHFSDVADFVGIFVIILIIFVRFLRIHRERERASSELAAARSVQELMIPRESPQTPGFHVDTVYKPATEVGGDFFHIQATGDGGLLIVIGDVAGHGLQAAMNVSMLMGALRRSPITSPAQILADLNQVLVGSSSFTTCEAAYFSADGEVVIASAGHPPPYLNSQEIILPGGLPLGVVPGIEYDETRLYLHPGDRLLLMSDGVAEARKPNGELFGFDRVRNLSGQSAFFIADAAKEFGQEDDITVLTIRRLAQAAAA